MQEPRIATPMGFLITRLENYIANRDREPDKPVVFFGYRLDYSKQQKINAAQALLDHIKTGNPIDKKHIGPLKNGDLGEHYKSYQDVMERRQAMP
ncbi:MAG: hypothetical protein K0R66_183 [Gammaproteobacteria bacterium]|jgi:hypothetical protein|nr:hypothetical protein [Gammaproteobacteria bacterium]